MMRMPPSFTGAPILEITISARHARRKYPPYVFSTRGVSCLVHKIAWVELHWWRVAGGGEKLVKLKRPVMIAQTVCSMSFRLQGDRSRTCLLPNPDALLCGRCHGDVATFGKDGPATKAGTKRSEAHVKLGCVVQGY
jgi:hypothetical protein